MFGKFLAVQFWELGNWNHSFEFNDLHLSRFGMLFNQFDECAVCLLYFKGVFLSLL